MMLVNLHVAIWLRVSDWVSFCSEGPNTFCQVYFPRKKLLSAPHGCVAAGGDGQLRSWETLNLFSRDLNVGGNIETHWSVSNKAALPAWHSQGERGYFAPWQQVTSFWNCQQTLIGLLKHICCNVRGWLPGGRAGPQQHWAVLQDVSRRG